MFYYHLKLHYSQTTNLDGLQKNMFYYHLKLHYSQTDIPPVFICSGFYTTLKQYDGNTLQSVGFTTT